MMKFYLLRHAESQPSAELPEADWPLSSRGQEQAQQLVHTLAGLGIQRLISSPYVRACQTIAPFAEQAGLTIEVTEDLSERKLSTGLIPNWLEVLKTTWQDFDYTWPGGESSRSCQQRVKAVIESHLQQSPDQTLLFSSHGNAISLYLHHFRQDFHFSGWQAMRNPDLFEVCLPDQYQQLSMGT